jgi:hypothetical protein
VIGQNPKNTELTPPRSVSALEFRIRWGRGREHYRDGNTNPLHHPMHGRVFHIRCPYCHNVDPGLGPDKSHHLMVKLDQGFFRCIRCNKNSVIDYLFTNADGSGGGHLQGEEKPILNVRNERRTGSQFLKRTMTLDGLPRDHSAWRFLLDDGFTEQQILHLGETMGIVYCEDGSQVGDNMFNVTTGRLVFLLKYQGKLEGWQARWLPKNYDRRSELEKIAKELRISKYLISPGYRKLQLPYNMDKAWQYQTLVAVEGVKKVWKTGPFALGTFGIQNSLPENPLDSPERPDDIWPVRALRDNKKLVILFDRNGLTQAFKLAVWYKKHGGESSIIMLPPGDRDDLDAYSKEEIRRMLLSQLPPQWLPAYV